MGIVECGCGRENNNARGEAECVIISRVYEHKGCFNWLVARSTGQDRSKLAR